jgi:hypothetical protein
MVALRATLAQRHQPSRTKAGMMAHIVLWTMVGPCQYLAMARMIAHTGTGGFIRYAS